MGMVVLVPNMVGSVPLRGKLDFDSVSCRASLESQKSLLHAGGPLESEKVMWQKLLSLGVLYRVAGIVVIE